MQHKKGSISTVAPEVSEILYYSIQCTMLKYTGSTSDVIEAYGKQSLQHPSTGIQEAKQSVLSIDY